MSPTVALITPHTTSHRTAEETLALGYLASALRFNGYQVTIIDGWLRGIGPEEIAGILSRNVPHVIGLSCYRSNLDQARELLGAITRKCGDIPVFCGGFGPTFHEVDFLNAGFAVVVRGEAEHSVAQLVEAMIGGLEFSDIPGITFRKEGRIIRTEQTEPINDLDSIQFPARDEIRFAIQKKNPVHVCTSRGCRGHCSFCSIFTFARNGSKNHRWRQRSIPNIVEELLRLYEQFGVTHIKFVDDSFLEPPRDERWVTQFAEAIARHNLPLRFRTQIRADRITEGIVSGLKQAGWFATSIGIENAAPSALKRMGKSASAQDNWNALELLRRHGIYVQMGMILFDDETTVDELEANYRFLSQHDWAVTKGIFSEMFAAEGTPYTRKLSRQGILETGNDQNLRYVVKDKQTRRVYEMLKVWHRSHSNLYDWVIDSITAPKVLPDLGYARVHKLCQEMAACDRVVFRRVLTHVASRSTGEDLDVIAKAIAEFSPFYADLWSRIKNLYDHYGLVYDGVPNPS